MTLFRSSDSDKHILPMTITPGAPAASAAADSFADSVALANSSQTHSRRTRPSSARKVLSAAGRPLRSVGRRLKRSASNQVASGNNHSDRNRDGIPLQRNSSFVEQAMSSLRSIASPHQASIAQENGGRESISRSPPRTLPRHRSDGSSSHNNWIVYRFENLFRQVGLLALAFLLGVYRPELSGIVKKIAEYTAVAWLTSLCILAAGATQLQDQQTVTLLTPDYQQLGTVFDDDGVFADEATPLLDCTKQSHDKRDPERAATAIAQTSNGSESNTPQTIVHPALEPFYVIDTQTNQRLFPNNFHTPFEISNDYFDGTMMILIRTPDADDPCAPVGSSENQRATRYLQPRQRRFEFQFQVRLKKLPTGRVYFCCELEEPVKMGMIQRAFVGAAMAFVRSTNGRFQYSITGQAPNEEGCYEKPHMAFPVEEGMNRVVATPLTDPWPVLGQAIEEDAESIKRRQKGGAIDWNFDHVYTLSSWSAYVDFLEWRCISLPGIRPFGLKSVLGDQAINLALYEIPEGRDKHMQCDMNIIVQLEMCNSAKSVLGPATRRYVMEKEAGQTSHDDAAAITAPNNAAAVESDARNDSEEEAVAELGEGIYVHSGDRISLREAPNDSVDLDEAPAAFLTNGAGFAIMQERSSSTIVIEKVGSKRKDAPLIKSGDAVRLKLVPRNRKDDGDIRYLTVHRGWWLKWESSGPFKNGVFTIHTRETEFVVGISRPRETQTSFLTLGGTFSLRHKRWSKFSVGVAAEGSATYGGRMLGLHIQTANGGASSVIQEDVAYVSDDDFAIEMEQPEVVGDRKGSWMKPLQLQAYEGVSHTMLSAPSLQSGSELKATESMVLEERSVFRFSVDDYRLDVPVWIEIMNRTDRVRQLVYGVRVTHSGSLEPTSNVVQYHELKPDEEEPCVRLRSGRDLAHIMRVGLTWRNRCRRRQDEASGSPMHNGLSTPSSPMRPRSLSSQTYRDLSTTPSFDDENDEIDDERPDESSSDSESELASQDGIDLVEIDTDGADAVETPLSKPRKRRQIIGKIAKSVKTRTASTKKKVAKGSVRLGKGTVSAGKAVIPPRRPKNPPLTEPRTKTPGRHTTMKRREKDLNITKSMRRIYRVKARNFALDSPVVVAGELSAPEQSTRTLSKLLESMSGLPRTSQFHSNFNSILSAQLGHKSDHDEQFLTGGAINLGVVPAGGNEYLTECVVARCLWESHWREEWCGLYPDKIVFYAPVTNVPCLELALADIRSIRLLRNTIQTPLPGFPLLVLETAWHCHYIAFAGQDERSLFQTRAQEAIAQVEDLASLEKPIELWKARFWQGFQDSVDASLSSGKGKWAEIISNGKSKRRMVLNNRRTEFDLEPRGVAESDFVESLLAASLSFSLNSLKEHPEELVDFLDATSYLRTVSLESLDLDSPATFCLFVNLYHCLLQHGLLFALNGPLHKRSCGHFMRTLCYEVGGDVFSLAELQCCIIRGKLSRPSAPRHPYIDVPKKSNAYIFYALGYTSPRVNFVVNTGDTACPPEIQVLMPECLEEQLNLAACDFVRRNLTVDSAKKQAILPRVCDVFRSDFTPDANAPLACLRYCLAYLDAEAAAEVTRLLADEASLNIRYQPWPEQYHSILRVKVQPSVAMMESNF